MSAKLNNKQRDAVEFVISGHNLVIVGKAGTGKSLTVKSIYERCHAIDKKCAVTATTGIACSVYPQFMNAMTIHRWSGIGDGRYSPAEIKNVVANNPKYREVKDRIYKTDILIIDEFSMLSKRAFNCLNAVCSLRNPSRFFGGIQVVLVGDLVQLPPVPCARYNEDGAFCFLSDIYRKAFPHRIRLQQVHRQSEPLLIQAIEEVSTGIVTTETRDFIKKLSVPLKDLDDSSPVKLFSTNDQVDDYNRDQILKFPGQLHEFLSNDTGDKKYLKEVMACRKLWLKICIPVILIRNLSDRLVNGLRGTVYDILEDGRIVVEFQNIPEKIYIKKEKFEVFEPRRNCVVATREQLPLKPAYALTIHKSQGMTLDRVEVDCREIFKPGQLGVAIGRARSSDGLRVINFSERTCRKQPDEVLQFNDECDSLTTEANRACCIGFESSETAETIFTVQDLRGIDLVTNDDYQSDIEDLEDAFNDIIYALDDVSYQECVDINLPETLSIQSLLEEVKAKVVVTPMQHENNEIISRINMAKLEVFVKKQYKKLKALLDSCPTSTTGQIVSKNLGMFYTEDHKYSTSSEFKMDSYLLFEAEDTYSDVHKRIACKIHVLIREFIVKAKAKEVAAVDTATSKREITHASRARIRYIGGYCVAKIRHKYVMKKATHRYSDKQNDINEYDNAKIAIEILNSLKQDEQSVMASTEEPDSLLDVTRRQNLNRGLTNIPDSVFKFFVKLTEMCLDMLTTQNLSNMGEKMFSECQSRIEASDLYMKFVELCSITKETCTDGESVDQPDQYMTIQVQDILKKVFHQIVKLHLMVMFNQFRKDTLDILKIGKKMAHRKQIRVSTTKTATGSTKRHTEEVTKESHKTKKTKQSKINKTTDIPQPGTSGANIGVDPEPDTLHWDEGFEPQPGTSTADLGVEPQPDILPADEGDTESEIKCKVCDTVEKEIQWIQCDSCDAWLHRNCAGLKHHLKWKKFQKKSSKFICKECE